jgi:hypothetical protein
MSQFEPKPDVDKAAAPPQSSTLAVISLVFGFLSFCLPLVAGLIAVVCGLIAVVQINASQGRMAGKGVAIAGAILGVVGTLFNLAILVALLLPAVTAAREAAKRMEASNNLKYIGLGLHNYHDVYRALPPSGVIYEPAEDEGAMERKLGLSWRVRILPFIEQQALYEEFDQHVPWDHPNNARLIERMPEIYKSPNRPDEDGKTVYLGVVYPEDLDPANLADDRYQTFLRGTVFDQGRLARRSLLGMPTVRFRDVTDGTSNTIAVVEADADQAVIWTKPDDWEFHVDDPARGLGSLRPMGFMALMLDGSTTFVRSDLDPDNLRRLFSRADGQVVDAVMPGR